MCLERKGGPTSDKKEGIDFDEIFSLVLNMTSIRTVLRLSASVDLKLEQLDVKIAFRHGDLEEIYVHQAKGFKGKGHMVCKLKKCLYGLNQSAEIVVQEV